MEKYYIIPHTHWDREWRYPIWQTRKLLADFMKQLLEILDTDQEYHYFLLDGQVAPIEDFLEIYPEERERLAGHIAAGRIGIGPWYTLPDLYPIEGECLIRNLNKGIQICKQYGTHLKVGYNSFGWGQTAQFPQIYADYGFDTIICAKKVSEERAPHAEFLWKGPDGTEVLTSRLGDFARANFFFHAYINTRYGLNFLSDEFSYSPEKAGFAIHRANAAYADQDYFLSIPKPGHDWARLETGLLDTFKANENTLVSDCQLLLSGCDFSTPQPDLTEILKRAKALFPDKEFVNARLEDYTNELHNKIDRSKLPVVLGELRDGPPCDCSGNALASRIYLKQANKKAQLAVIRRAEPLCAAVEMAGLFEYPKGFIDTAWKYMLDSQSHDAINGVTQDKTAQDVEYRLAQAVELGQVAADMAVESILRNIDFSGNGEGGGFLCVVNPLPRDNQAVVRAVVDTPKGECAWSIGLADEAGEPVETQELGRSEISSPVHDLDGRPWPFYADRHELFFDTGVIPAMGYRVFQVSKQEAYKPKHHYWYPMRKTRGEDIITGDTVLENEHLIVQINANGSFDLTEKAGGRQYHNLHYFEDTGDVGNYWAYYPPYSNRTFNTLSSAPRIWIEENGMLVGTVGIEHAMRLPAYGEEPLYGIGKSERAAFEKTIRVITKITLKKRAKHVEIETRVINNIRNHRLRVAFPTNIEAQVACASGHFTVDARPVVPTRDEHGEYWKEMQTLPMQNFVDRSDGKDGFALLSNDVTEYEALDDKNGTTYLTLFRAMGNMIVTGWECVNRYPKQDGSQLLRTMDFAYAVYPHQGDWKQANVCAQADRFINEPAVYQVMGNHEGGMPRCGGFVKIEDPNLILSAFKKADDGVGYVLRVYNPTENTIETKVVFFRAIKAARYSSMAEESREAAAFDENRLFIQAQSGKIVTFRLEF